MTPPDRSLLGALATEWGRLTGAPHEAPALRLMKVSSRPGRYLPMLFFLFRDGAASPSYALKVNRDPSYPDAILREFRNYSAIWARGGEADRGMPRPVFCERIGEHVVLCETYVGGRRCEDRYFSVRRGRARRKVLEQFLVAAVTWLREFHARTRSAEGVIDAARVETQFQQPLRAFAARAETPAALAARLAAFAELLPRLVGRVAVRTAVHGDFDHGNILIDGARISVVDWEDCEPAGNPLVDLTYLIVHLALVSDLDAAADRRLEEFFAPGSWTLGLVRALLTDYARGVGLEPDAFFLGLPGTVIEIMTKPWGVERDPRSIPVNSIDRLAFVTELATRELRAA